MPLEGQTQFVNNPCYSINEYFYSLKAEIELEKAREEVAKNFEAWGEVKHGGSKVIFRSRGTTEYIRRACN